MKTSKKISFLLSAAIILCMGFTAAAQNITVKGVVLDENSDPVPGAAVMDKQNSGNGTVTGIEGKFTINVAENGFLEISSLGFKTVIEQVNSRKQIEVRLQPDTETLDDVVVIAYGTAHKDDLTGAVTAVNLRDIEQASSTSVGSALQGRVAGADIVSTSGEPGDSESIQIRGSRSISAGNEPLIVVDGVPDAVTDISELNPSDIKSISVLKDVSSTALYGSRGANGVILITTDSRNNQEGKFSVNFKASCGLSKIARSIDMMDAAQFGQWCNDVKYNTDVNNGVEEPNPNYYFENPEELGRGTDWVKALTRLGVYQDYSLGLSMSTKATNIQGSVGYNDTQGVMVGSGSSRFTSRLNVTITPFKWMKIGVRANYTDRKTDRSRAAVSGTSSTAAIYLSPLLGIEDTWNYYGSEVTTGGSPFNSPWISARNVKSNSHETFLNIVPWVDFNIGKYVVWASKFSFVDRHYDTYYYSPSTMPVAQRTHSGGTATITDARRNNYLVETTVTFKRTFNRAHALEVLAGHTAEKRVITNESFTGTGFLDDNVTYKNLGGMSDRRTQNSTSNETIKTTNSFLARVNYDFRKRYYITLTGRVDGASNFANDRKWGFFPAVALRWNIKSEPWMKRVSKINVLALRASAGRSGNDAISTYMSIATITPARTNWMFGEYQDLAFYPTRLSNPELTWETTDSYNVGLNFAAFKNRLDIEVEAYHSLTSDLLLPMTVNKNTGYDNFFTNMGTTTNAGVEVSIVTKNIVKKKFTWETNLTLTHNKQMVKDIGVDRLVGTYYNPTHSSQPMYGYRNGYPANSLWGYQYAGVWYSDEEIARNQVTHSYVGAMSPVMGRSKFVDVNKDGILDQNDLLYLGNSDPIVFGGFKNTFYIGNFVLNAYLTYSIGGYIYNIAELRMASGARAYNKMSYMVTEAWHPSRNPEGYYPKAGYSDYMASSRMVHDASYLRLKEISLKYNFKISDKVKFIKSASLGFTAENLALWTKYNGFDPDVSTESTTRRIDSGSYPRPMNFIFNFTIKY